MRRTICAPQQLPFPICLLPTGRRVIMSNREGSTHQAPPPRAGYLKGIAGTLLLVALIRAIILAIGITSIEVAPPGLEPHFNYEHPWIAWDARHYHEIALNGYSPDTIGRPYRDHTTYNLIAYFPLVPMSSRALGVLLPLGVAMVTISNVCAMIGFAFVYLWAQRIAGSRIAAICTLLMAVFPGAVSFAAGMSEGPFFMLTAMTLWLLQTRQFYLAAMAAGVATFSRPTGVAVAMVVPLYAWTCLGHLTFSRRAATFVALGIISVSGLLAYEAFLWHRYKSPTAYFDAQQLWKRMDNSRVEDESAHGIKRYSLEFFQDRLIRPQTWNRGIALLLLIVIVAGFIRPKGIPRLVFLIPLVILLMTTIPDRGLRVSSLPRYESAAAPVFLLVAIWFAAPRRFNFLLALLILQLGVQMYYAWLFPREIWVG
jgi:hypothetical protein